MERRLSDRDLERLLVSCRRAVVDVVSSVLDEVEVVERPSSLEAVVDESEGAEHEVPAPSGLCFC